MHSNSKHYLEHQRNAWRYAQLSRLADRLKRIWNQDDEARLVERRSLINRILRLLDQLRHAVSRTQLRKALGGLAFLFGLTAAQSVDAQNFAAPLTNPFGLQPTSYFAIPVLVDIDADGDLDLFSSEYDGQIKYFQNTGDSANPQFAAPVSNPFNLSPSYLVGFMEFADFDNDGDLDALVGEYYGHLVYYQNIGQANAPSFGTPLTNPFGLTSVLDLAIPSVGDLDNDGDLDIIVGEYYGNFRYFMNTGSASAPSFAAPQLNPFGLSAVDTYAFVELADLDLDGDLDILAGEYYAGLKYFQNTGSASNPQFALPVTNPFGLSATGQIAMPASGDLDADGDIDLIIGNAEYTGSTYIGNFNYFRNTLISAGFDEADDPGLVTLYPNPSPGILQLHSTEGIRSVEVLNMYGQSVRHYGDPGTSIDMRALAKGPYMLRIVFDDGRVTQRKVVRN